MKTHRAVSCLAVFTASLHPSQACYYTCPASVCVGRTEYHIGAGDTQLLTMYHTGYSCPSGEVPVITRASLYTTDDDDLTASVVTDGYRLVGSSATDCFHAIDRMASTETATDVQVLLKCDNWVNTCDYYIVKEYACVDDPSKTPAPTPAPTCGVTCSNSVCGGLPINRISAGGTRTITASDWGANCPSGQDGVVDAVRVYALKNDVLTVTYVSSDYYFAPPATDCFHIVKRETPAAMTSVEFNLKCENSAQDCEFYGVPEYSCSSRTTTRDI